MSEAGFPMEMGGLSRQREAIGPALGRIPSGCAILTAGFGSQSTGVLVSWFQQASFDPPAVSVALRTTRPAAELVERSGRFLLNVMDANPTPMFKHFGRGFSMDEDAFEGLEVTPTPYGTLLRSCIAHLGCRLTQKVNVGDHNLYIGTVEAASEMPQPRQPYVHLRANGFSY